MTQTQPRADARSFPLYIAGERIDTDERAYGMSVRSVLEPNGHDTAALLRLLREGTEEEVHAHPHVLCSVSLSTVEHGEAALAAASAAAPLLRAMPPGDRLRCVRDLHAGFFAHREEIARILRMEGCPRVLVEAQLKTVLDLMLPEYLDLAATMLRQEVAAPRHRIVLQRRPDGVVCVDPPANAPLYGLIATLVLVAGNAVVIRVPRSCATSLSYALHEVIIPVFEAHGAPPGAINVLCADFETTMRQWLDSPSVDTIYYFGSSDYGLALERRCVERGKKAILELSGNDGVLVWRDADLEHATAALLECFYASGQACIGPKYVIAHPDIAEELLTRLAAEASALRPGDPETSDTVLSPVLRATAFRRALDEALHAGAVKVCGGARIGLDGEPDPNGLFIEPTVLRVDGFEQAETMPAVRDEKFFPMLSVVVPANGPRLLDDCLGFLDRNRFGLRNSLWAEDATVVERFTTELSNGGLLKVNDSHMANTPYLPGLGGTGASGGTHGEAAYPILRASRLQAVAIATSRVHPRDAVLGTPAP
ncbi:aldehyde dehydrogenase family protein [Saccharothrix australiensis]|uniref:Acyl-CoA reductase-like NAD-dependent aldehyde dehydrogenase n=1 Tax=Saccharothrix australiensis TaxID=2072 RepID=A0A495VXM6_9PSEU|nr:aldehyde dehydrogenase [Saccharothrix australiensis]RKT54181.1 acyl-CoA reductase-like NAD-dependent aldehyde dehydrogenase [Saccharothrix australiensis]